MVAQQPARGELIARGNTSDVWRWTGTTVVKVLRPEIPSHWAGLEHQIEMPAAPDPESLTACRTLASLAGTLSGERVRQEALPGRDREQLLRHALAASRPEAGPRSSGHHDGVASR